MLIFLQNTKRRKFVETNNKMTILIFFRIPTAGRKWCEPRVTEVQVGRSPQRHRGRPWEGVELARGEQPTCRQVFPNLTKDDQAKEKLLYDDLSELAKRKVFFHVSLGMVVFSNILKSFPRKVIDRESFQGSCSNRRSCRRRISSRRKIFRF